VAFEVLYDRHNGGVLAFCRHMLRSADEAEDVVQHAFIAAYTDLHRDSERDIRFKAWIYTIARNRCLSVLRARREHASDDLEITTDRLGEEVQHRADLRALLADLGELPEDQREALVLSEVGDLSHADVAQVIGCEASKVKSLVYQARTALIERRQAREIPCAEIREQIATLRGGALRRSHLRHHINACPGCAEYREEVRRQRQMFAVALPVIPTLGLREQVLAAVGVGAGGGAAAGGAGLGGLGVAAKTGLAKVGIAALVATGAAGGTVVATHGDLSRLPLVPGGSDSPAGGAGPAGATHPASAVTDTAANKGGPDRRSQSGTEHGFTPVPGESNGERAREFAKTRGQGKHKGLNKPHHTRALVRPLGRHRGPATIQVRPSPRAPTPSTQSPRAQPVPTTTAPTTTTPTAPDTSRSNRPDSSSGSGGAGVRRGGGRADATDLSAPLTE
jgi:RNA polymerase sigma factor (sigma-70 family)